MHSQFIRLGLAATCATLVGLSAEAASINTSLSYSADNVGLGGGKSFGFDKFKTTDVGLADLTYGAKASSGDVDAEASISFNTTFQDTFALSDAENVDVSFALNSLSFGYDTYIGASAGAYVDFDSFNGINLSEFEVIGKSYDLATMDSKTGFGSTGTDSDTQKIGGVGPDYSLGLGVRAVVNLNASQESSFLVDDFTGLLIATHESGAIQTDLFSLQGDALSSLDLALAGEWTLSLADLSLQNFFDTALGVTASYELGLAFGEVGGGCGDYSTDSDNENSFIPPKACVADWGVSDSTSQLTLIDPAGFMIDWGMKTASLGTITVLHDATPVPLPAGVPLLLTGLAGFAWLRRRV